MYKQNEINEKVKENLLQFSSNKKILCIEALQVMKNL